MKAKTVFLAMGLFLLAMAVRGGDANDRFKGGSFDGWTQQAMSNYIRLSFLTPIDTIIFIR